MAELKIETKINCYHCGDECLETPVKLEGKSFCCTGCKTVFEILNDSDLCQYYSLEKTPGISRNRGRSQFFDFLDNPEIASKLLEFSDEKQERVTFLIPNIHCSSCIWLLEHLDRLEPAVVSSKTNFSDRKLTVNYHKSELSLKELAELLDSIGYTPVINLEEEGKGVQTNKSFNKQLLVKMGIAGFCFGNVMLLSFPDYLGVSALEQSYQQFFRWLNVLLSVPVVFYSGNEYFIFAFKSLKQRFANIDVPIALGISVLFLRSVYEVAADIGPGYFDSLVGLVFFLLIGRWFQNRTYKALSFDRDYKSYFPLAILTKRLDQYVSEPVSKLKKGDEIQIRNGELIPTDAILVDDRAFVDYSFVTGESEPVEKVRAQYVYAGGRLKGRKSRFVVQKPVSQSYLTELWNDEAFHKEEDHVSLIDRVSQYFTVSVIFISIVSSVFWQISDPSKTWLVFCSVLIIACPCALALSTPFTTGSILRVLGRNKIYLKNAHVIEKLQKINSIVFDKTGTITNANQQSLRFEGEELSPEEIELVSVAVSSSTHPLSRLIKNYLSNKEGDVYNLELFEEHVGLGIRAMVSGLEIRLGSGRFLGIANDNIGKANSSLVFLKIGDNLRGRFIIENVYRENLRGVIDKLKERFKLSILSGDRDSEKGNLENIFPIGTEMKFKQKPEDKLSMIKNFQSQGDHVMMLGDGLNDAGALKQSDVGVAVSEDVSTFSPACDAIMQAESFDKLNEVIALAKYGKHIVVASFILSLIYNGVGIAFAVSGWLTPLVAAILMPLSSISVVAFTTIAVRFFSLKLKL